MNRLLDVAVAISVFLATSPLIAFSFISIRLLLGSPVLFSQQRPGLHGKLFTLYKFRTMRTPRAGQAAILRPDGRVLLAGGVSFDDFIILRLPAVRNTTEIYNPATNTTSVGPSMVTAHSLVDPVPLGSDRYLIPGGISALSLASPGTSSTACEVYNALANTFTAVGSMATARVNQRSFPLDSSRFICVGGGNGTLLAPIALATSEIFDAVTSTWSPGPALTVPRAAPAMFRSSRGQVHFIGGGTANGAIATSSEFHFSF